VPLPDRIIYVTAPVGVLVERSMRRRDRRRELATADRAEVERWTARAAEVFDRVLSAPRLRARTLVVDNSDDSAEGREAAVDRIMTFIHGRTPGDDAPDPSAPAATREA